MYAAVKNSIYRWLFQLRGPQTGAIVLAQRRVFILPTRQGLTFAAMLMLMLLGSINYNLSLGFVLTFLLAAMGVNAMVHTFRNLANLRITAGRAQAVFAGDIAHFTVHIENGTAMPRYSIGLTHDRKDAVFVDVPARSSAAAVIGLPAPRRGLLRPGRMTLYTRYPLGLFRAWAYLELDMQCIVYPRPAYPGLALPPAESSARPGAEHGRGQEDFSGLRQYHLGDSPRHIAWKVAARDRGLLTKQFSGRSDTELWLDWALLPAHMGTEEKLSQLARWVLDAHAGGLSYGLRLPGKIVDMALAEAQRERCLEALALYDREQ
ncbi:MAG: DUF58 domain-containing protein [Betaproteobacteria bacterium]|nr:DUF58 domain-containing protein [Betaproteobacteria bacterium]